MDEGEGGGVVGFGFAGKAGDDIGTDGGMIGCRMTGAGFGGCAVSLVKTDAVSQITRQMSIGYERKTKNQATIFPSRPAAGARVLK